MSNAFSVSPEPRWVFLFFRQRSDKDFSEKLHRNQYSNTIKLISIISLYSLCRKNLIYCSISNNDLLIDRTSANSILPAKNTFSIASRTMVEKNTIKFYSVIYVECFHLIDSFARFESSNWLKVKLKTDFNMFQQTTIKSHEKKKQRVRPNIKNNSAPSKSFEFFNFKLKQTKFATQNNNSWARGILLQLLLWFDFNFSLPTQAFCNRKGENISIIAFKRKKHSQKAEREKRKS